MLRSPYLDASAVLTFQNECAAEGSHYTRDSGVAFVNEAKCKAAVCAGSKDCWDMQGLDERCCVRSLNPHQFTPSLFRPREGKKRGEWGNGDTRS